MKRYLCFMLAAVMLLMLAACGAPAAPVIETAPPAAAERFRWKEFTFLFHFHCFPATSARYNIPHVRLERGRAAWRSEFFL